MANISSWFQRLVPLSPDAAQAAVDGAAIVVADSKERREQQQVASADAASTGNRKQEG